MRTDSFDGAVNTSCAFTRTRGECSGQNTAVPGVSVSGKILCRTMHKKTNATSFCLNDGKPTILRATDGRWGLNGKPPIRDDSIEYREYVEASSNRCGSEESPRVVRDDAIGFPTPSLLIPTSKSHQTP